LQGNLWTAATLRRFDFRKKSEEQAEQRKAGAENQSGAGSPQSKVRRSLTNDKAGQATGAPRVLFCRHISTSYQEDR